jgi:hypothetical protein
MREELRRNNSIGNGECIDRLVRLVFDERITGIEALHHLFRYYSISQFNCHIAIIFFEDLGLLRVSRGKITLTNLGLEISALPFDDRKTRIASIVLNRLLDNKLVNLDKTIIDSTTGELKIPANSIALSGAIYRNFLYENDCFMQNGSYLILKNKELSEQMESQIVSVKKKTSQEELLLQLKRKQEDGDKGELFVLEYEVRRLLNPTLMPKRVSLIDVSAGYDILSFEDSTSLHFDRYIEVKSFRGTPHFYWSANEKRIAEVLGENYFIYLVDLDKTEEDESEYTPTIIANPVKKLFEEEWLIEPDTYKITRIV